MALIRELIVDAYGCALDLSEPKRIEKAAREALEKEGATIVRTTHYDFQPHGLTLCFILKESHFVISTWPEHKMAIINIFLCNENMDTKKVWTQFSKALSPTHVQFHEVVHHVGSKPEKKSA